MPTGCSASDRLSDCCDRKGPLCGYSDRLARPGQVVTRDQLLERVWGYDYAGETRTVDVHVHWLRTAIEVDPANPTLIQTIRGVGYVLRRV